MLKRPECVSEPNLWRMISRSRRHAAARPAYRRGLLSSSRVSSAFENRALPTAHASFIAARVSALGTLSANGNCLSAAIRVSRTRTASETDKPIAVSALVAWVLIFSFTRSNRSKCAGIGVVPTQCDQELHGFRRSKAAISRRQLRLRIHPTPAPIRKLFRARKGSGAGVG